MVRRSGCALPIARTAIWHLTLAGGGAAEGAVTSIARIMIRFHTLQARSASRRCDELENARNDIWLLESGETAMLFRFAFAFISMAALLIDPIDAVSQDMLRHVDLNSPDMTVAEMTRAEVDALLEAAHQEPANQRSAVLEGKR